MICFDNKKEPETHEVSNSNRVDIEAVMTKTIWNNKILPPEEMSEQKLISWKMMEYFAPQIVTN